MRDAWDQHPFKNGSVLATPTFSALISQTRATIGCGQKVHIVPYSRRDGNGTGV
jgi:hypothetical protein